MIFLILEACTEGYPILDTANISCLFNYVLNDLKHTELHSATIVLYTLWNWNKITITLKSFILNVWPKILNMVDSYTHTHTHSTVRFISVLRWPSRLCGLSETTLMLIILWNSVSECCNSLIGSIQPTRTVSSLCNFLQRPGLPD